MRPLLLATLVLGGCGDLFGQGVRIKDASCDEDFLEWTGGPTFHVLQGDGDGLFDYDPAGEVETRIAGSYDLATGDMAWEVEYAPAHYRLFTTVEGYGTIYTDGDLDWVATVTSLDILGEESTRRVREVRTGCDVHRRTTYDPDTDGEFAVDELGTFEDGVFSYSAEGETWAITGTRRSDLTWTEAYAWESLTASHASTTEGEGAQGYWLEEWEQQGDGYEADGYSEGWKDGRVHHEYTVVASGQTQVWDYEVDYGGTGGGTLTIDGYECTLTYTDGSCTYDCGGSTGSCD